MVPDNSRLPATGYVAAERAGRRNRFEVSTTAPLRHPDEQNVEIGMLLEVFSEPTQSFSWWVRSHRQGRHRSVGLSSDSGAKS